ncbi:MAG: hemolysin family protein [Micrococcales bacterium]|nr:hemolysin family protein [Micrococcales bacterium]MCL2667136.1 hemolysin family protein [Micrococcales bacterium]
MIVVLGLLVAAGYLLAALLSAGEVAVIRVTHADVARLEAAGHPAAARVEALADRRLQVADAVAFVRLMGEMTATVAVTLVVAMVTDWSWWGVLGVCLVLTGGVAWGLVRASPRSIGRRHPAATLTALARLLTVVTAVAGRLGGRASAERHAAGAHDELRNMVDRVAESTAIDDAEREMVRSVMELGDTLTREVMVPRTDMVTVRATDPAAKALTVLLRSGYSRVPVVGGTVDDLRGVLYLKDVVRHIPGVLGPAEPGRRRGEVVVGTVADLARPAHFVPESKPVDDLLRELRDRATHIAMVVDEYGGIAGLVTIEDALEEIVGELTDEHDRSAPAVDDLGDGVFRVPARLGRDELGELFGLEVDDEDVDTAGGLLAKALGKVPLTGSCGQIHGLHLTAERVEGRRKRLATVLVRQAHEGER